MSTTIALRPTKVGDELYHLGLRLWCKVVAPGIVEVHGINDQKVRYTFSTGGLINNRKQLSWHMPLIFDAPVRDVSKYQTLLDTAHTLFKD